MAAETTSLEGTIEQFIEARTAMFRAEMDRVRAEMVDAGIGAAGIRRAEREATDYFAKVIEREAQQLARQLSDVLPSRSMLLH